MVTSICQIVNIFFKIILKVGELMKNYYMLSIEEVEEALQTESKSGLNSKRHEELQKKYGLNKLKEKQSRTGFQILLEQFANFLVIILIIAAIISIVLGEYVDGIVILVIVVLNAILGLVQELKASNALKSLKELAAPTAKVIRNGNLLKVASSDLVPGDLVVIEAGDYIPSDLRLVESINLKIDESALTGESVPVDKKSDFLAGEETGLADRINMAYMSTIVTYGRGKGIVTSIGMDTEIGNIASMLNEVEEEGTILQKKLAQFGKYLGIACLIVSALVFILGLVRNEELLDSFMTAISLAVAAIPEGLPAVVTVVLALGMQKMIKRNAIVKRLGAVETLGSTTVICTDKTGTLTQNKMMVTKIYDGKNYWDVSGTGYNTYGEIVCEDNSKKLSKSLEILMRIAVLCNDASLKKGGNDIIGDPTEGALVVLGAKGGYPQEELNKMFPRISEFPFDSERKLMSTVHDMDNKTIMYTKGAPDVILSRCTHIYIDDEIRQLTEEDKQQLQSVNNQFANEALRVLGYAYKELGENYDIKNEEKDLVFIGLSGMMDPPREEVRDAVNLCHTAGIRVVMITGDHKTTATAIAKKLDIIDEDAKTISGDELNNIDDDKLKDIIKDINVFARVSPQHKVRIVKAIKSNNEIAAMTGDGVNDAPALKQSDIGIAMGITGTDVAKDAADMILTDDNFNSIVKAVEEGRVIYSNIRKFVGFLLTCNIGELLLIFIAMLFGWGTPLLPIHLLWINLMTDSFPAFALGMEEKENDIMNQKPRNPNEPITDKRMSINIGVQSIVLAAAALISYKIGISYGGIEYGRTFCFTTLIMGELLRSYSARSERRSIFGMNIFNNKYLNLSVLGSIILLAIILYVPVLQNIFRLSTLDFTQILIAVGLSLLPIVTAEIAKHFNK